MTGFSGKRAAGLTVLSLLAVSALLSAEDGKARGAAEGEAPLRLFNLAPARSAPKLWTVLRLVEEANSGDPLAQHELGLWYLTGEHYAPDTAKAAYWIGKAALQNLIPARYNMGILLDNGWGLPWNPFEAFRHFQYTARHGMKEAQYVYGLLWADNLVVPADPAESSRWIERSSEAGYGPAAEVLAEVRSRGPAGDARGADPADSLRSAPAAPPQDPRAVNPDGAPETPADPGQDVEDTALIREALSSLESAKTDNDTPRKAGAAPAGDRGDLLFTVQAAAEAGSPEALVLMGREFESWGGRGGDEVAASVYYLRAIRNHSPRAPVLLGRLIRREGYEDRLAARVRAGDPAAEFVWADLNALGFDGRLTAEQSLRNLEKAASRQYAEAALELSHIYYSGKGVAEDRAKGRRYLEQAAELGSREARIRRWMMALGENGDADARAVADSLSRACADGSVLAQAMLGFCYQNGTGVERRPAKAVRYFRKAAHRGYVPALRALRGLYDELRPADPEFQMPE